MKVSLISLLASAGLQLVVEAFPSTRHVVHEKRGVQHQSVWKRHSRAPVSQVLPMKVGLKQRNLEFAEQYIMDVADPTSPNYGKHWSAEKVAKTFAPAPESSDETLEWLVGSGISRDRLRHSVGMPCPPKVCIVCPC